ncbi:MAG: D-2-hydroxyacid dehydrogenase [Woeseiaceae bacterium]|nr:D-2-hydroxyacid dehydrogenase [Woeseiaceae bacterium]
MADARLLAFALLATLPSLALGELSIDELIEEAGIEAGAKPIREAERWQPPQTIIVRGYADYVGGLGDAAPGVELVAASSNAEALAAAANADAIIGFCNPELVAAAPRASWIQIFSSGAERCLAADDVADGTVVLTNMQKMSSPVIGEHAIAMMLSLTRGLVPLAKHMESGEWDRDLGGAPNVMSVADRTLLVVGLGGIGREVAVRAHALGMRVLATRNSSRSGPDYVDYVGLSDELHELAAQSDVIVNALPLTPETEDIFDAEFFAAAKEGALFITVGRGGSTVTDDLVAALESGRIAGAGLDVTDPEPLPADHPLWQFDNVIITPHVAAFGEGSERHRLLIRENLKRFLAGDRLLNVVDPEAGY